jgi:hypothetical protein
MMEILWARVPNGPEKFHEEVQCRFSAPQRSSFEPGRFKSTQASMRS